MFLMLVSHDSYVSAATMSGVMDEAIQQGYFGDEKEFVDCLEHYQIYEIGEPLKITGKIGDVIFTIQQ